jgi:hypothetical protein
MINMTLEMVRPTGASTIYTPSEKATVKQVSELEVRNTDILKYIRRIFNLTMDMPENMSPSVANEEQMKANVLAIMNAWKYHVPKSLGVPLLVWSLALIPAGTVKVAVNVTDAMSTEPRPSVRVESVN